MRPYLVGANWSLNYSNSFLHHIDTYPINHDTEVDVFIAPPHTHIPIVYKKLRHLDYKLAAQDCSIYAGGSYTGETTATMLKKYCKYIIIGQSSRRHYFYENDAIIKRKVENALAVDLHVILCVGETGYERLAQMQNVVVERQLRSVIDSAMALTFDIAYEPAWQIGNAPIQCDLEISKMLLFIKSVVKSIRRELRPRIIYGGPATGKNLDSLVCLKGNHGFLVTEGATFNDMFYEIIRNVNASHAKMYIL